MCKAGGAGFETTAPRRLKVTRDWKKLGVRAFVVIYLLATLTSFGDERTASWFVPGYYVRARSATLPRTTASDRFGPQQRVEVIFAVSGAKTDVDRCLHSISSYKTGEANLLFNFYDGTRAPRNSSRVFFSSHPGYKPVFWSRIDVSFLDNYEFIWLLDADMIFHKKLFAFEQFMFIVRQLDASIATPNIHGPRQDNWLSDAPGFTSHFAVRSTRIEQGKPLMKTAVLQFLNSKRLINPHVHQLSDWGPDFFWCALAEKLKVSKIDCIIVLMVRMLHMDTKTISDEQRLQWNSSVALDWYATQTKKLGIYHRFNEAQKVIPIDFSSFRESLYVGKLDPVLESQVLSAP